MMFIRMVSLLLVGSLACSCSVAAADSVDGQSLHNTPVVLAATDPSGGTLDDFDAAFGDGFDSNKNASKKLISDPLENWNRGMFWVNDKLYFYLFKPIAKGYRLVLPRPARVSVANFFSNIATPIRAGNALLQLKFRTFGTEVYRFVINTTFGLGGLFDPAESVAGVRKNVEDFGQTLGYYGTGHGFYLVLPIVGPSSLRDATGSFVDSFADPFRYADLKSVEYIGVKWFDVENRLSLDRDTYEGIVRDSLDPYLFIRAAYAQQRRAQVGENFYNTNLFEGPLFDNDVLNPFDWFGFE